MTISIGGDHAGYECKEQVIASLNKMKLTVIDRGPSSDSSVDYPDHAHPVAIDVATGNAQLGILICGSGNGVCMTANKHEGVRAALCWKTSLAELSRQHNDANILCIPARFVSNRLAVMMVKKFLSTPFEGGRHANRVNKISC
jgi:ribose 5-phosphate isomerase B